MKHKGLIIVIIIVLLLILCIVGASIYLNVIKTEQEIAQPNIKHKTGKVYNKEIKTITIKYYNGYNIATGDAISDTIPAFKIELKGEDLEEVSKLVKSLTYYEIPNDCSEKRDCINSIYDNYELIINNDISLYLDNEYGFTKEDSYDTFKIPEELFTIVSNKVDENNKKNVYKQLNSKKFTIIKEKEKLEVTDKKYVEELSNYNYYNINAKDESFTEEKIEFTLDLNDGRKIELYRASPLSRMINKDGSHFYIYSDDLSELVAKIYNNSKLKINFNNVTNIRITFKGKEYKITDKNKKDEIINELKYLRYDDYYNVDREIDYDENDLIIYINKAKYIIPKESFIGNRYFIDETGKVYSVSDITSSKTEKYIKELVGYKE